MIDYMTDIYKNKYFYYKNKYLNLCYLVKKSNNGINFIGGGEYNKTSYELCCQEFIFSKFFPECVNSFNKLFSSYFNFLDEKNNKNIIDPFTECQNIFIQTPKNKSPQFNNYNSWDPVIHSYYIEQNGNYVFSNDIKNLILSRLTETAQQKLYLDKLYLVKFSTIHKIKDHDFSVIDILDNFIDKFNKFYYNDYSHNANLDTINDFKKLIKSKSFISDAEAEELQTEIIKLTKPILENFISKKNGIYDFYCKVRSGLDNDYYLQKFKKHNYDVILFHENDKYTISFFNDTINIKIHDTRYNRLMGLYIKYLGLHRNLTDDEIIIFNQYLYACIRRYRTVFWQHRVFFGNSMPPQTFELWKNYFKGQDVVECFADPFNCYLDKYYSPFGDVDKVFGSIGSFFDNPPTKGCAIAHPPTEKHFLEVASKTIFNVLSNKQNNITFIIGLPVWKKYMKTKNIIQIEKYPSFGINVNILTLSNSDLEIDTSSKKTYTYRYRLYILSNSKEKFDTINLEKIYTEIFINFAK